MACLVLILAWYDLKAHLKDRRALVLLLLLPTIMTALVAYGIAPRLGSVTYVEPFAVAIVDHDNTPETRQLVHHFSTAPSLRQMVTVEQVDERAATALLAENRLAAVLVLPQGFVSSMARGENLPVRVVGNPARALETALIRNLMETSAALVTAAQSGINTVLFIGEEADFPAEELNRLYRESLLEFGLQALGRSQVLAVQTISATGPASPLAYYAVAIGVSAALFAGMAGLWDLKGEGKGLYLRLRAQGLSPLALVLSRLLVIAALQVIQLALLGATLVWLGGLALEQVAWPRVGLLVVATLVANASLLVLISVTAPTAPAANLLVLGLMVLGALAGGSVLPAPYLPGLVRTAGALSINRWAIDGLLAALYGGESGVVGQSLAMLFLLAGALVTAAALRLRSVGR